MATRIKVVLSQLYVKKKGNLLGKARWHLNATANGDQYGDPKEIFVVKNGTEINLPEAQWHKVVEVERTSDFEIRLHASEKALIRPADFGSVTRRLKWPFQQGDFSLQNAYFRATFSILLEAQGEFKRHDPREVFACRESPGNPSFVTVTGVEHKTRFEACEVRSTPPTSYLPARISSVAGEVCFKSDKGLTISDTDPINVVPNSPTIPIMVPKDANEKTAARIEINFYQPNFLKLDKDDPRLT